MIFSCLWLKLLRRIWMQKRHSSKCNWWLESGQSGDISSLNFVVSCYAFYQTWIRLHASEVVLTLTLVSNLYVILLENTWNFSAISLEKLYACKIGFLAQNFCLIIWPVAMIVWQYFIWYLTVECASLQPLTNHFKVLSTTVWPKQLHRLSPQMLDQSSDSFIIFSNILSS